jgi:imidazoleglycerol-phosphate dehydratase
MKHRIAERQRKTGETDIFLRLELDGGGTPDISTGIAFFDHMLHLMAAHGMFGLDIRATGDVAVDWHHTVEDVGLVLGDALSDALGDRKGIHRYGHAVTPMDESLATVTVDLSNRPYLVYNVPFGAGGGCPFDAVLAKEFFRAFSNRAGMNLHINVAYGENDHHILEAVFKACGRALSQACSLDARIAGVRSTKGLL